MEPTIVILEESTHAEHYALSEQSINLTPENRTYSTLVHNDEFKKVKNLISGFIPDTPEKRSRENLHNTITILGTRGSGKTSFLLTVKDALSKGEIGEKVEMLQIIDPTLIEEKGHVFLNIIAIIKDLIDRKLDSQEYSPHYKPQHSRKDWRTALNKLAAGLPSIDGVENNVADNWQDPEFVMDAGLKAVHSAQDLRKNFNRFLELSLGILKKEAFVVLFDDIDVDARKGWAVLETIRKYFTGSRLITIVSGDSQLYSTVVRQNKWQNFGKEIIEYEGKQLNKLAYFNEMMVELESQYLQKILQPKHRIHLSTIGTIKRYNDNRELLIYKTKDEYLIHRRDELIRTKSLNPGFFEIDRVYGRIFSYFGINNSYQASAYRDYMIDLPLRSQVQFLNLFDLRTGKYCAEDLSMAPLTDIFLSGLYAKQIDVNSAIRSPKNLNRIILDLLLKEKKLEELYQLQPVTNDDALNASLLCLNFLLSKNVKEDASIIFDYFIRIGYIRNLVPFLGYKDGKERKVDSSVEDLSNNTVILNENVLKDIAGKITAYIRGVVSNPNLLQAGTIPLFGLASTRRKNVKNMSSRIDAVLKEKKANYIEQMLAYMPLSSNQYVYRQSSLLTYSPYVLFGAIGELIRKVKASDVRNGFIELSQFRGYMMPDFVRGDSDEADTSEDDSQDFPERNNDFHIEEIFSDWVNSYPKGIEISVHLLGKIATRFFYAITNLENNGSGRRRLGEIFHAYILTFMNAVLVEDCRENASELAVELSLNNTQYSNDLFIKNINKLIDSNTKTVKSKNLAFSQWMLACPLLLTYLDKNPIEAQIRTYCSNYIGKSNNDQHEDIFQIDLRKYLDFVLVRGRGTEEENILEERIFSGNVVYYEAPPKKSLQKLSIGDRASYAEIRRRLDSVSFDYSKLQTGNMQNLRKELSVLGIIRPSVHNFNKFLNYLNSKK